MLYQYGARQWGLAHLVMGGILGENNLMSTPAPDSQNSVGTPNQAAHPPAALTTLVLVAFAAVYLVWGSTYLAIRIGVESFPPLILAGLRHVTVGLLLYPILRRTTGIKPTAANWRAAVVTGALLLFAGNGGVSWAERTVPSGITALLAGARLLDRLWVGHRIQRVPVYSAEEHGGACGDVCVCESHRGAVPGVADRRRVHHPAHCCCCSGHPHGGHIGDHRAAPKAC